MTFSICVRERYEVDDTSHSRFGVAVTTRRPSIGARCPFVSEHGAIATQSVTDPALGRAGLKHVREGLRLEDSLTALLNVDSNAAERQVHGVCREDTYAFSGDECGDWYGHTIGENYTVAGNLLAGEVVLESVISEYEDQDRDTSLSGRLVQCLRAGQEAGGDKRTGRTIQSAAVRVRTTEETPFPAFHNDLRVDATESPIQDLQRAHDRARSI